MTRESKAGARVGILPLARATFDVPYAQEMAAKAYNALAEAGFEPIGSRDLLFDAEATERALDALRVETLDLLLILQVTFTDATMTVKIAQDATAPLAIWAMPEPRAGGRLRLNSFCGMNLAMHALGRAGRRARWLYAAPDDADIGKRLNALAAGPIEAEKPAAHRSSPSADDIDAGAATLAGLTGANIGIIGEYPAGFDTCRYDAADLAQRFGVNVQNFTLPEVFRRAAAMGAPAIQIRRDMIASRIDGIDSVDQPQLDRSLRVYEAMKAMAQELKCSALAVRCWPEMFTDYGCAACGPIGLLIEAGIPAACEADALGALTSIILQKAASAPAWLVDVVDMDEASDTSVFWHCGSAPLSMAGGSFAPRAQVHSNRRMPLLAEFTLKPGRVTIARVSQARNQMRLVLGRGEIIDAPMSFTGTSAVVRFDRPAGEVMSVIMDEALEHHFAFAYGDYRGTLRALAQSLGLPVLELA